MGRLVSNYRGASSAKAPILKTKSSPKILLVLQFWEGDKEQAMQLARFIADLSPGMNDHADFLFAARFDCPQDNDAVKYVSRKFNVWTTTCRRRGVGWPHGCNELWFGTMSWIYDMITMKKLQHYKAVFTFEADCVPMRPDWLQHFCREWDAIQTVQPIYVAGALLRAPGEHINGNAMFSTDLKFLRWIAKDIVSAASSAGWDFWLAPQFRQWGWAQLPGLLSYWNAQTMPEAEINRLFWSGIAFLHGVKDDSLFKEARRRLLHFA
jgi:hypothetical protein